MRTLVCLAALAITDAAAKFALEKKGQKVINVKLYETGYTFTNRGDQEKKPQTLREISGCSFGKKRDNGRREITLVEDKGYIITSSVLVKGEIFRYAQFDKDAKTTRTLLGLRATDKGSSHKKPALAPRERRQLVSESGRHAVRVTKTAPEERREAGEARTKSVPRHVGADAAGALHRTIGRLGPRHFI